MTEFITAMILIATVTSIFDLAKMWLFETGVSRIDD